MESLGQKIRKRRMALKMTQSQLAEGLVSASAISQIESDKINPTYKLLIQLADRLEVPIDAFLSKSTTDNLEQSTAHTLAKAFMEANEYQEALPLLEDQYATSPNLPDVLKDLALCYLHLRNYRRANELLEDLLKSSMRDEDHSMYLWALNVLGSLFYKQNKISLALHYWQKAYDRLEQTEFVDPFFKTQIIRNLALVNYRLGYLDNSTKLYGQSQALLQSSSNLNAVAANYLGLGTSLRGKREFHLAEDYFQKAITIYQGLNEVQSAILAKENFGIIRGETGDYQVALQTLQECLAQYQEHGFIPQMANTHAEIAKVLIRMSRLSEAERHIELAFQLSEVSTPHRAQCFFVRSLLHKSSNHYSAAISDAIQAKNIFAEAEALGEYSQSCLHLSDLYKALGDYKSSTEILEESQRFIQQYLREKGVII